MLKNSKKEKRAPQTKKKGGGKMKRELGGIALMLMSLFLAGAILSFDAADAAVFTRLDWYDILGNGARDAVDSIHSPFGLLGARLSSFFVRSFLGYPTLLLLSAIFFWGLELFRSRSLKQALLFFLYTALLSFDLAAMAGMTSTPYSDYWSGSIGRMTAELVKNVLGPLGGWVLLVVIAAVPSFYLGRRLFVRWKSRPDEGEGAGIAAATGNWLSRFRKKKDDGTGEPVNDDRPFRSSSSSLAESTDQPFAPVSESLVSSLPDSVPPDAEAHDEGGVQGTGGELETLIRPTVKEKEANLDERTMKVATRDHVPYRFPSIDLLEKGEADDGQIDRAYLEASRDRLLEKLAIYKIAVVRISMTVGPRVTLFEMELAPDVKVSRVLALENDLAMALAAQGIRIIAPIPGKNAVGVEIPNSKPKTVWLRSVLQVEKFKNTRMTLPIVLGRTIANEVYIDDLASLPHLLIAGATGSGKSVGINVIITSLLYSCSPDKVKFLLIDPKRVELFNYTHLKSHFLVKFPDIDEQIITDPQKAIYALKCVEKEMDMRYITLQEAGMRNIGDYNKALPKEALPYLVVVIDELADLMITAGREVEEPITRLAQLARAVGIHLILATQRPSVDVITGIIKANFPSRIAFQVSSRIDSRTILDGSGAEKLLRDGDMLYHPATLPKPIRIQGPYVSSKEVEAVTSFIGAQHALKNIYMLPSADMTRVNGGSSAGGSVDTGGRDQLFEDAARLVVMHQQGSVSLLQRRLRVGFGRAGRIMDQLCDNRIVGPADGSRAREVLIGSEESLELLLNNLDPE